MRENPVEMRRRKLEQHLMGKEEHSTIKEHSLELSKLLLAHISGGSGEGGLIETDRMKVLPEVKSPVHLVSLIIILILNRRLKYNLLLVSSNEGLQGYIFRAATRDFGFTPF